MMSDLGSVIGPLLAGYLLDTAGFSWAFFIGAAVSVVALLVVVRSPETLHRSEKT